MNSLIIYIIKRFKLNFKLNHKTSDTLKLVSFQTQEFRHYNMNFALNY